MTGLVKYEAARAALQAAHDVDEVKDIRDKAQAMAAYAKQANDTALVEWATEIKVRAERRAGEMLAQLKINGARHDAVDNLKTGPKSHDVTSGQTLESLGISKNESSRWQKLAAIPEKQFEEAVAAAKEVAGEVTTAALLRMRREAKPAPRAEHEDGSSSKGRLAVKVPENFHKLQLLHDKLKSEHDDLTERYETLADTARDLSDKLTVFETTELDEQQKLIATLQKRIVRLEAEVDRVTVARNDANNKNNVLIREVKRLQKKQGVGQ